MADSWRIAGKTAALLREPIRRLPSKNVSQDVLCVDLDGTLIAADLLWESLVGLVKRRPLRALRILWEVRRGKAHFKRQVAAEMGIEPADLPYREDFLNHLRELHRRGTYLVLATASDSTYAHAVAAHLGVFAEVIASDGVSNLSGRRKAAALVERFGERSFGYVGNDWADIPVWRAAAGAVAVAPSPRLVRYGLSRHLFDEVRDRRRGFWKSTANALRPHQWVKNVLVFVPMIAAHTVLRVDLWRLSVLTFLAFSLCASAIYVLNDIADVQADRLHSRKRTRPFAAGDLSIPSGIAIATGLLCAGMATAVLGVSWRLAGVAMAYVLVAGAYSAWLKRTSVAGLFVLTALYVVRIVAGGVATSTHVSSWLLAFALFFFLSVAFVKRDVELISS